VTARDERNCPFGAALRARRVFAVARGHRDFPAFSYASAHARRETRDDPRIMKFLTHRPIVAGALLCAATAFASSALAQFSSDAATPLAIAASAGEDVQPKIARAANDGQYVSYFAGAGYDIYLDLRDSQGNAAWAAPLLIEDRAFSSTTDYALTSDAAGNSYVVYNASDPNNATGALVKMVSVAPSGSVRWTTVLYTSTLGATSLGSGRATVASDGFIWGAYAIGFDSAVARVNPKTGAVTSSLFINENATTKQMCSGLQPSTDGAVIFSTIRYTTISSPKTLRLRRINADGTYGWGGALGSPAFVTGSIQTGNFPDFIADGSGGAYVPWYTTSPLNCRMQHFDSTGAITWGTDGVPVSANTTASFGGATANVNRTNPATVVGADGRIYCFYRSYSASIAGIVWYGLGAQCFNPDGTTAWGADGAMLVPHAPSAAGVLFDQQIGSALNFGRDVRDSDARDGVCVAHERRWQRRVDDDPRVERGHEVPLRLLDGFGQLGRDGVAVHDGEQRHLRGARRVGRHARRPHRGAW